MSALSRRAGVAAALAATTCAVTAMSMPAAVATPPSGLPSKISDLARVQVIEGGTAAAPPGTDAVSATYTLEPGFDSGWRTEPGTSVFAVTKGVLSVRDAKGCSTKEYRGGQAAVVPAGQYDIADAGDEPVEFAGIFLNLAPGAASPLVDGVAESAPTGCRDAGHAAFATATPAVSDHVRATMVPIAAYGHSVHARGAHGITAEPATDMLVTSYEFPPGFSTGWITHQPQLAFVTRGTLTYYEGRDGRCVRSETYRPGQAFIHQGGLHMAVNEGTEPLDATIIYFNLPHGSPASFVPGAGSLDGIDFTALPPTDCPRPF
jgi:quercetin dioxygenase-like cupin family protein